jgi:hypothetical protein
VVVTPPDEVIVSSDASPEIVSSDASPEAEKAA